MKPRKKEFFIVPKITLIDINKSFGTPEKFNKVKLTPQLEKRFKKEVRGYNLIEVKKRRVK